MVFNYFNRLTPAQKRVYRRSDQITTVPLPDPVAFQPLVKRLESALKKEDRKTTQRYAQELVTGLTSVLDAPRIRVEILQVRPSNGNSELHGFYIPEEKSKVARIKLWMRTAKLKQVVAFKTFFRTLLHELCHHLDYEVFGLPETFHTQGFYRRESHLVHQLLSGTTAARPSNRKRTITRRAAAKRK